MKKAFTILQLVSILMAFVAVICLALNGQIKEFKPAIEVKVKNQEQVNPVPVPAPAPSVIPTEEPKQLPVEGVKKEKTPNGDEVLAKSVQAQDALITRINAERSQRGIRPVVQDQRLVRGASRRAKTLSLKNQWSHEGLSVALGNAGLKGMYSENLAKGYEGDINKIVTAWLNSPTHNAVMLNSSCTIAGVGRYNDITVLWLGVCGI